MAPFLLFRGLYHRKMLCRRTLSERFGHCSLIKFFEGYAVVIVIKF